MPFATNMLTSLARWAGDLEMKPSEPQRHHTAALHLAMVLSGVTRRSTSDLAVHEIGQVLCEATISHQEPALVNLVVRGLVMGLGGAKITDAYLEEVLGHFHTTGTLIAPTAWMLLASIERAMGGPSPRLEAVLAEVLTINGTPMSRELSVTAPRAQHMMMCARRREIFCGIRDREDAADHRRMEFIRMLYSRITDPALDLSPGLRQQAYIQLFRRTWKAREAALAAVKAHRSRVKDFAACLEEVWLWSPWPRPRVAWKGCWRVKSTDWL